MLGSLNLVITNCTPAMSNRCSLVEAGGKRLLLEVTQLSECLGNLFISNYQLVGGVVFLEFLIVDDIKADSKPFQQVGLEFYSQYTSYTSNGKGDASPLDQPYTKLI